MCPHIRGRCHAIGQSPRRPHTSGRSLTFHRCSTVRHTAADGASGHGTNRARGHPDGRSSRPYVGARVLRTGASLTQSRGLPSKALFGSAYMCWEAPVSIERMSVGLDVHARSVVAAAIDGVTGEVFRARLTPGNDVVVGWVRALPGPSAVVYEAGPTGFGLSRAFTTAGIRKTRQPWRRNANCGRRIHRPNRPRCVPANRSRRAHRGHRGSFTTGLGGHVT
jgi:hypothetical protein